MDISEQILHAKRQYAAAELPSNAVQPTAVL